MRRGEIWWGEQPPPVGRRPFLIVSTDALNDVRNAVIAAPISTRIRGFWTEVSLGLNEGLPRECVATLAGLMSVRKTDMFTLVGQVDAAKMLQVETALRRVFEIDDVASPHGTP
ncbi:MAG: type II toxin-antitoxin system PemK/MazF family toxin [Dehalococcoidia bacterium]|nr:type II toxin-antitoxin system PemK/MazF family toxin [Dehalococcoidia bacterium]